MQNLNPYRWIKILAIAILMLALATSGLTAALRAHPGLMLLIRPTIKSRSPFCTIWQAIPDMEILLRQRDTVDRIRGESRMVRREGDVTLWQTASGDYWVPSSDDAMLPILLAQTARGIYGTGAWDVQPGDVVLDAGAYVGTYTVMRSSAARNWWWQSSHRLPRWNVCGGIWPRRSLREKLLSTRKESGTVKMCSPCT
jgi:hypothetical protein